MDEFFEEDDEGKSKTQLKKEMLALQELGEALVALPEATVRQFPLDDKLLDAILEAPRIKKHGARRRHFQFIGKLMRNSDHEAIASAYDTYVDEQKNSARKFHQVEYWRDQLILGDADSLQRFLQTYPHCDRQQLMQLIRNCQKEQSQEKNLGGSKKLFRFLRELILNHAEEDNS